MLEALGVVVILLIGVGICWKCSIAHSTLVLIVLVAVALCAMTFPGREFFEDDTIDRDTLVGAGIIRPSVYNCVNLIGNTAEQSALFAQLSDMM